MGAADCARATDSNARTMARTERWTRMPRHRQAPSLSPGQAHFVIERLLAERRITATEVSRYVGEIGREIAEIERRLGELRAATGSYGAERPHQVASARTTKSTSPKTRPTRRRKKRRGNVVAGSYMGYMRQIPADKKAKLPTHQARPRIRSSDRGAENRPREIASMASAARVG